MAEPGCPICRRPTERPFRPFCSQRCADVDLGRWVTGQYVVPGPEGEAPDGAEGGTAGEA